MMGLFMVGLAHYTAEKLLPITIVFAVVLAYLFLSLLVEFCKNKAPEPNPFFFHFRPIFHRRWVHILSYIYSVLKMSAKNISEELLMF